jgi:hypothetical protein
MILNKILKNQEYEALFKNDPYFNYFCHLITTQIITEEKMIKIVYDLCISNKKLLDKITKYIMKYGELFE